MCKKIKSKSASIKKRAIPKIDHSIFHFNELSSLLILFFISFMTTSCSNYKHTPASKKLDYDAIKGAAISVVESEYLTIEKFGKTEIDKIKKKTITEYNQRGKKLKIANYWDGLNWSSDDFYKYDSKGILIEEITQGNTWKNISINTPDSQGKIVEENYYEPEGTLKWRSYFKYDNHGNKIEQTNYDGAGKLKFNRYYKYDTKGNELEECLINENGYMEEYRTFKYDISGNLIEQISLVPNETFYYKFDINSNKHKTDGSFYSKFVFEYHESIDCIQFKLYRRDGSLLEVTNTCYKDFDSKGNWLTKTDDTSNGTLTITQREIKY